MSLHILQQVSSQESTHLNNLIQNLIVYDRTDFINQKRYILLDTTNARAILSSVQTLQQNFPFLVYSKIEHGSDVIKIARQLGGKNLIILKNGETLEPRHLHLSHQLLRNEINKDKFMAYNFKDINLRSTKSIWRKILLYLKNVYE